MKKTILYISDLNSTEPLFHSQVFPHVNAMRNYFNIVLLGMTRGDDFNYDFSYKSMRGDLFFPIAVINFMIQYRSLKKYVKARDIDLIYSRGFRGGLVGILLKKFFLKNKVQLLNDVRADILDEHKHNLLKFIAFWVSCKIVINKSNILFFVSSNLRNLYLAKFKFEGESAIFPTFVPSGKFEFLDARRFEIRKLLGYSEKDIVVLYSGNLASWQMVNTIISSFNKSNNLKIKLLILTKDDKISSYVSGSKRLGDINFRSVDYSEINNYYCAADIGVLLRENISTNRCAYPTKLSEYVNSGLAVITTRMDSDYIRFLTINNLDQFIINNFQDLTSLFDALVELPVRRPVKLNILDDIVENQSNLLLSRLN